MVLTQAHEDGGNSKANRLLAKVYGHLWRLDDVSVEAVVRVLKKGTWSREKWSMEMTHQHAAVPEPT